MIDHARLARSLRLVAILREGSQTSHMIFVPGWEMNEHGVMTAPDESGTGVFVPWSSIAYVQAISDKATIVENGAPEAKGTVQ